MKKRDKFRNVDKERQYEDRKRRDNSKSGFWVGKLSVKKALPLALVLAMVFSIEVIAAFGDLPRPNIKPDVESYVSPSEAYNWTVAFTYYLNITTPRNASITALEIYQPATNTWEEFKIESPWIFTKHIPVTEKNITKRPFIKKSEGGHSSYRFKYEDGILNTFLGPYPGPYLLPKVEIEKPTVNFSLINLTAYRGPRDFQMSYEADYHNYSGDTTAFDFNINAIATNTQWYDISLLLQDPVTGEWMVVGNKKQELEADKTETLKWEKIRPFESLDKNRIDEYIGKQSRFKFVYDEKSSDDLPGPELVVAFDNPECNPTVVPYKGYFNYSIGVIGSKGLNITLEYLCEGKWISDNITSANRPDATWNYSNVSSWTPHTWRCQAINTWEDVRFRWWE
jgi:hypothetical protein